MQIDFAIAGTSLPTYEVEIWTKGGTNNQTLGTKVATLTKPTTALATGLNSFTSASGVRLNASSGYFVLVDLSSAGTNWSIRNTASNAEDAGAAAGWSIFDSGAFRNRANTGAVLSPIDESRRIAIKGFANSPKLVGNTGATGLTVVGSRFDYAQAFTTGSNAGGYKLTRVDIRMLGGSGTAPSYSVSIHSDSSSLPGTSLGTLSNPPSGPAPPGSPNMTLQAAAST